MLVENSQVTNSCKFIKILPSDLHNRNYETFLPQSQSDKNGNVIEVHGGYLSSSLLNSDGFRFGTRIFESGDVLFLNQNFPTELSSFRSEVLLSISKSDDVHNFDSKANIYRIEGENLASCINSGVYRKLDFNLKAVLAYIIDKYGREIGSIKYLPSELRLTHEFLAEVVNGTRAPITAEIKKLRIKVGEANFGLYSKTRTYYMSTELIQETLSKI